jgi:ubiquinone/menaquinone biosynthesis C-methylase UbiE
MTVQEQALTPPQAYEQYFRPAIFEPLAGVVVERASPRPGERVLDLACGTGIVARRMAAMVGTGGRVAGVDVNPAMLDVARGAPGSATITWQQGNGMSLDLADGGFDLVVCQQGLQFFPDRRAGVAEMRRVLAKGGRAVVAVWQGIDRHPLFAALAAAELPHLRMLGAGVTSDDLEAPFSLGDAEELRDLLAGVGFRDIAVTSETIEARFATPERFIERMEYAYAAVVPQLAEDPAAFAAYLDAIAAATREIVARYRVGDRIVVPMHAHVAVARA